MNNYEVRQIRNLGEADPFILDIHYAKRKPSISYIYGLFDNDNYEKDRIIMIPELIGICSFGMSASPNLSYIAGEKHKNKVIELNRLCIEDGLDSNILSFFVSFCLNIFMLVYYLIDL